MAWARSESLTNGKSTSSSSTSSDLALAICSRVGLAGTSGMSMESSGNIQSASERW